MLNILALETDLAKPNTGLDLIRSFLGLFDKAFYGLLAVLYRVFFNVTTLDLFGENIMRFFQRVQIIIGVYMMFQLAMTIMKGIIDPENFTKTEGGSKGIVSRIIISLFMLVLLIPTRTDGNNEFEKQINNQGLLFGSLNSLQYRIISNNTIGKLILGLDDEGINYVNPSDDGEAQLIASSNMFASSVLKGFYRINLIPEEDRDPKDNPEDKLPEQINAYRMCKNMSDEVREKYTRLDADPFDIIDLVNETCSNDGKKYMFTQVPFISSLTAIVFCVVLLSFTIDVTVRSVKLAMLRLLAPIPIISYMDPKGSKDGAFNSWVKTLTSTYLDLFVRLATVYFVLYIIQDIIVSGLSINSVGGSVGIFSYILIFIGLFAFAWQAPKFIRELLGIKGDGGNFFSGLGALAGVGAGAVGMIGSARTNWRAASEEGKALYGGPDGNQHKILRALRTGGSAIAGAAGGGFVAARAMAGKDPGLQSVLKAQAARNAQRAAHSTLPGRFADSTWAAFTGRSLADKASKTLEANKAAVSTLGSWKKAFEDAGVKYGGAFSYTFRDDQGNAVATQDLTYRSVQAAVDAGADENGYYHLANGDLIHSSLLNSVVMDDLKSAQARAWKNGSVRLDENGNAVETYDHAVGEDGRLRADHERAVKVVNDASLSVNGLTGSDLVDSYDSLGTAIGSANRAQQTQETDMRQQMRISNKQQNN